MKRNLRTLTRWQSNRLRRLEYIKRPTPRQLARISELHALLRAAAGIA